MKTSRPYTLRVPHDLRERIDAQAERQRCLPSELIRRAVVHYLDGHQRLSDSELRHLRVAEYTQVALDAIIREEHPELRDTLVLETDRRMERYHGAR
ncbi:hypothetical protein [Sphingomonas sp. BK580]|uniref:hypothetical protein n=1 Tax=Sphingomonas sp. BK580 TaxID=2586972 RepID=UPI0018148CBF|nr:hypothetical protein [Sphingomonas sp. BK580]MBB3694860.1 putative transcriptional regulator [Sphingomonas sp. BK580]